MTEGDAKKYGYSVPGDLESERAVLGSVLNGTANFDVIGAVLSGQDFLTENNRRIFVGMKELAEKGEAVDRVTLATRLMAIGHLESVGGMTYIVDLGADAPPLINLDSYIRTVRDKSIKRRAIYAHQRAIDELVLDVDDAPELLAKAEQELTSLRNGAGEKSGFMTPIEIIQEAGGVDEFLSPRTLRGIPTPWHNLNELLTGNGFSPGQLVIIGARPAAGKTALAANIAIGVAKSWRKVCYVSLEMSSADILRRMVCAEAQVNLKKLSQRDCGPTERHDIAEALDAIGATDHPGLLVWRQQSASVMALRGALRQEATRGQIGMVIVDYLQLMESSRSGKRDFSTRAEAVAEMSRGLKLLAMELRCPVIALSQLNREQEKQDRRPRLSDLRESGSIEQDADIVLFPYSRAENPLPEVIDTELEIAKQRNGPLGMARLLFHRKFTRFIEA